MEHIVIAVSAIVIAHRRIVNRNETIALISNYHATAG
jgi:hypothetical protein